MPPVLHRQAEARRLRRPRRAVQPPLRLALEEELSIPPAKQRAALLAAKLGALVADQLDGQRPATAEFPGGATLFAGGDGWILLDADPERGLGPALAWALRRGCTQLHVLADRGTSTLARRAARFALPVHVWHVDGANLLPAIAGEPDRPPPPRDDHLAVAEATIAVAGATVTVEHGGVGGEVRGLEVCRVVDHPLTGDVTLEVGIGVHDREVFAMLHGDVPNVDALADVVRQAEAHRKVGAAPHPLNRLARERFVRWRLIDDPGLAGAGTVTVVEPVMPRRSITDRVSCAAVADSGSAAAADLVCSAGIDLDLVPYAADVQRPDRPLRIVLPARDLLPLTRDLAGLLRSPVEFVTID